MALRNTKEAAVSNAASLASWAYESNFTDHNLKLMVCKLIINKYKILSFRIYFYV